MAAIALIATATWAESQILQTSVAKGQPRLVIDGDQADLQSSSGAVRLAPGMEVEYNDVIGSQDRFWVAGSRRTVLGRDLFVIAGDAAASRDARELALPRVTAGTVARQSPVLLADPQRPATLEGVAWVEGPDPRSGSIRFAGFDGGFDGAFGPVEVVSPPGPGSQLALRGAVLNEGELILVWSAFDGRDDEIMWSRRRDGRWSPPARIHPDNQVPDITPALAVFDHRALAVWSWYDGNDYRLVASELDAGVWGEPRSIAGAGSLYPELLATERAPWLLFYEASPPQWRLDELDERFFATRSLSAPVDRTDPPAVIALDQRGAQLEWPATPSGESVTRRSALWEPLRTRAIER